MARAGMVGATRARRARGPPRSPARHARNQLPPLGVRVTLPAMAQYSDWNLNRWLNTVEDTYLRYRDYKRSELLTTIAQQAAYDADPQHWELTQYTAWQSKYASNSRKKWSEIHREEASDLREQDRKTRIADRLARQAFNAQQRADSAYASQQRTLLWQDYSRTEHRLQQALREATRVQRKAFEACKAAYEELQRADRELVAAQGHLSQLTKPVLEVAPVAVYQPPLPPPPLATDEWAPYGRDPATGYALREYGYDRDDAPHGRDADGYPCPPPGYVQPPPLPPGTPWGQPVAPTPATRHPWDDGTS